MVGSEAVVGKPLAKGPDAPVYEYALNGQTTSAIVPLSAPTLSGASIKQEAGVTILTFTRKLNPQVAGALVWRIGRADEGRNQLCRSVL